MVNLKPAQNEPKPGDPPESTLEYTSGGIEIKCADPKVKVIKKG